MGCSIVYTTLHPAFHPYQNIDCSVLSQQGGMSPSHVFIVWLRLSRACSLSLDDKMYSCQLCSKNYTYKNGLKRHVQHRHEGSEGHLCDRCGLLFTWSGDLSRHRQSIHLNRRYSCNRCDKSFTRQDSLTHHIKKVHQSSSTVIMQYRWMLIIYCQDGKTEIGRYIENQWYDVIHECVEAGYSFKQQLSFPTLCYLDFETRLKWE